MRHGLDNFDSKARLCVFKCPAKFQPPFRAKHGKVKLSVEPDSSGYLAGTKLIDVTKTLVGTN